MRASIYKSDISGRLTAPSSKSYTIRGLFCAALARGESEIVRPLGSEDTEAAFEVLSKVGVNIRRQNESWQVSGGNLHEPGTDLFCGDSALTIRFMTAIASIIPGRCRLTAGVSLAKRPMLPLMEALRQAGVDCSFQPERSHVVVKGGRPLKDTIDISGDISSQFVSAMLLISPFAERGMTIRVTTPLESRSFVIMTRECLKLFGIEIKMATDFSEFKTASQLYRSTRYIVEGDWTSASYLLALGALGGDITVDNINTESLQGDKCIVGLLGDMGASVMVDRNRVRVKRSKLKAIEADLNECIDLLPTMAVLAAAAEGRSRLCGIARARFKESDRVIAVREGLERIGIKVLQGEDELIITGGVPKRAVIDSMNDHRIAMAFSLLGVLGNGVTIERAECVGKTFPDYWENLRTLGGKVQLDEQ